MDQSRLYDLLFIFVVPTTLIIALCDEIGYFNKKIVSTVLVTLLVLAWGLISYLPVNPSVDKIQYDEIAGLLTIFFIVIVFWIFKGWDKIEKAVKPYDKVLEANPDDSTSLNNKGTVLTNLKRYNWSMEYFDKVLELDPDDSAALHNKGVVLTKLKNTRKATEKANEYFDRALEADPGFENAKRSGKIILET
jgi:tetratricopeptide (TPR) repeat protein